MCEQSTLSGAEHAAIEHACGRALSYACTYSGGLTSPVAERWAEEIKASVKEVVLVVCRVEKGLKNFLSEGGNAGVAEGGE